jgi:acyl phosphate:glycerol-3-phosphate acyltransferase
MLYASVLVLAYLIGSIPTAVWIGKFFYKTDVREHGSKNAGATNTFRVLGKKPALSVFLIDVAKGFLPVYFLPILLLPFEMGTETYVLWQILLGVCVVLGHTLPVFALFRGGKGVASLLGIVFALQPFAALFALGVFMLVLFIFRYVSLGSMIAGISFPCYIFFIDARPLWSLRIFSLLVAVLLIYTHRKNINRLLNKQEPTLW